MWRDFKHIIIGNGRSALPTGVYGLVLKATPVWGERRVRYSGGLKPGLIKDVTDCGDSPRFSSC